MAVMQAEKGFPEVAFPGFCQRYLKIINNEVG